MDEVRTMNDRQWEKYFFELSNKVEIIATINPIKIISINDIPDNKDIYITYKDIKSH